MKYSRNRCEKGIWDNTIPGIVFNGNGESNYYEMFERYANQYSKGEEGRLIWNKYIDDIKKKGKGRRYDCIIGISGGTDSSFLLHLAKKNGLRSLAVTVDNGWSSDISVKNIKKVTTALNIDLETYVIEYEEIKDILTSYMKAGLPWIDFPSDHAIKAILYKTAKKEKIKYILIGHDFRSEGMQPSEWTYGDSKQLKYIHKQFGCKKIKTFPLISFWEQVYLGYIKGIKMIYPYYYFEYNKKDAQKFLEEKYNWQYYGGHHHENAFTKFAIAYWMKRKFNIDKRLITLSAQVLSGEIRREVALEMIKDYPYDSEQMEKDKEYTIKKLGLTTEEFQEIWNSENKNIYDYPSHKRFTENFGKGLLPIVKLVMPQLPGYFVQLEIRNRNK